MDVSETPNFNSCPEMNPISTSVRAEIDTSAPFESVKEAATRFGGIGFWKPTLSKSFGDFSQGEVEVDVAQVEQQAAVLEEDLIVKERETLEVLKELETTKVTIEELKSKLQKEESNFEKENIVSHSNEDTTHLCPTSAPGFILLELKQAKLNLTRTTSDLADIRTTVESYKKKIERERILLEKTRQRLSSSSSKVSSLEQELNQTKEKLKDAECCDLTSEIQKLTGETQRFKEVGEAAKSQVLMVLSEMEQTKTRIKTAEIRLVAAKKMKAAARAAEAVALADIKALSKIPEGQGVTLTFEEYSSLLSKAQDAQEAGGQRVKEATMLVDEANISKTEILKKVEEATEEVKVSKKALEEALKRVEAASDEKLAVEEALRNWRSENEQRRRSVHNSTKFKNPCSSSISDEMKPVLKSTLSIGQILNKKLLLTEEFERKKTGKRSTMSLAQMMGKAASGELSQKDEKENGVSKPPAAKRKKFGLARISHLVTQHSKKKKRNSAILRCRLAD